MLLSTKEAAKILEVDERSVRRYIKKGLLKPIENSATYYFQKEEVECLKNIKNAFEKLKEHLRFSYAHSITGVSFPKIINCINEKRQKTEKDSKVVMSELIYGLKFYAFERNTYMKSYQPDPKIRKDMLFINEAAERLRIKDIHVIHRLIKDRSLASYTCTVDNKKKYFVSLESMLEYLGEDKEEIFLRSDEVVKELNFKNISEDEMKIEIRKIDKLAKKLGIGKKVIPNCRNSCYLFTELEVNLIKETYLIQR